MQTLRGPACPLITRTIGTLIPGLLWLTCQYALEAGIFIPLKPPDGCLLTDWPVQLPGLRRGHTHHERSYFVIKKTGGIAINLTLLHLHSEIPGNATNECLFAANTVASGWWPWRHFIKASFTWSWNWKAAKKLASGVSKDRKSEKKSVQGKPASTVWKSVQCCTDAAVDWKMEINFHMFIQKQKKEDGEATWRQHTSLSSSSTVR